MSLELRIRSGHPDDARGIVEVIRNGFNPSLLSIFIYGCPGVERFVREQIAARRSGCDTTYTVACDGERVVGCIEMRRFRDELFLNYISILPDFRSRDLGKRLLKVSIAEAREEGQLRLLLDVLDDNVRAKRWYESMGFDFGRTSAWWEISLPDSGHGVTCLVSGIPQAQASHREYGFSLFRIATANGDYSIGRLGENWFRLTQPEALKDPAVGPALHRIDPSRRILALLPDGSEPPPSAPRTRRIAIMRRVSTGLEELMNRLL